MALPGSKISKRERRRLKKKKFRPLGSSYKNRLQLRRSINRRTAGTVQSKLQPIRRDRRAEKQKHRGNVKELGQTYTWYQQQVQTAFDRAQTALNKVLATNTQGNEVVQSNLLAALEGSRAADRSQASAIGGVIPEGLGDDIAVEAAGAGSSAQANLANMFAQNTALAAGRIGTAGVGRTRALEREKRRSSGIHGGLRGERKDVEREIPSIREEHRKNILDEELAKGTERSRQAIARKSLKLEGRKAKEEKRSNEAGEALGWAGIRTERQKIQAEVSGAGSDAAKEKAIAKRDRFNAGVEVLSRYLENNKKESARKPAEVFRLLTLSVSRQMALRIMSHGPSRFQQFAKKRRSGKKPRLKKGPPAPGKSQPGP